MENYKTAVEKLNEYGKIHKSIYLKVKNNVSFVNGRFSGFIIETRRTLSDYVSFYHSI